MAVSRLFEILYYLVDHKQTTAKELAEYFEVSVRTIYRDLDRLLVAGIPINTVQGNNGGISIDENFVVEKAVNNVGVDINTASVSLLQYVAGLNAGVAKNIIKYRDENGKFTNRKEIMNVSKLGAKTYQQAIGFLRIPGANDPFDATAIHPENYQQAKKLLELIGANESALGTKEIAEKLGNLNKEEIMNELQIDSYTLDDIIDSFIKPNRSPRDNYATPLLKKDILKIDDLKPGMVLEGTVRNVVDFGAFIDIGLKNDGLVHISKISHERIKHPLDKLSIGDIVEVYVIDVDINKHRVGLSMIKD